MSAQCDFELLQQWLSNCCTNHSCSTGSPPERLPARFIKINNEGVVPELQLVSSRDVSSRYAALSYCWGGNFTGIKTTKATLEQHHAYIELSRLPKTIRDATQITRALGIEYLWVDSLCIVQDDQEDWATESKRMAALYQSAVVTLVATAAKDANQGCLFPRKVTRDSVDVQLSVDVARDTSKVTFTNHTGSIANDFLESPWNKRAWCLQEYVLSPRMLHFFENRIVWQCRGTLSAEDFVELRRSAGAGAGADFRVQHILTTPSSYFSLRPPADLETWFRLVEEYSTRSLTQPGDKLVALAALATYLRPHLGSEYVSGLWLKYLDRSLLWLSKDSRMQTGTHRRAPSWSWAALDGPVAHLHRLQSSLPSLESTICIREGPGGGAGGEAVETSPLQPLFLTSSLREITRSNSLIKNSDIDKVASAHVKEALRASRSFQAHYLYDADDRVCGWAIFDQEDLRTEELFCLHTARMTYKGAFQSYFVLVVMRSRLLKDGFERVGVGEVCREDFFNAAQKIDVNLI